MKAPESIRPTTVHTNFASCDGNHPPLFAVREGVDLEDALVHLSLLLRSAHDTNAQAIEMSTDEVRGMLWATQHPLEAARALVESVLSGVEAQLTLR